MLRRSKVGLARLYNIYLLPAKAHVSGRSLYTRLIVTQRFVLFLTAIPSQGNSVPCPRPHHCHGAEADLNGDWGFRPRGRTAVYTRLVI